MSVDDLATELGFTEAQMTKLVLGEIPIKNKIAETLARLLKKFT
jgi:plasmid maintenance system antidote protein VapI